MSKEMLVKNVSTQCDINAVGYLDVDEDENRFPIGTPSSEKDEPNILIYNKKRPLSCKENVTNWNIEDAEKAILLQHTYVVREKKSDDLVITFPDNPINSEIVQSYSSNIESVSFLESNAPRFCYVTLKPGTAVDEEIEKIGKIQFQNGFLKAKLRDPIPAEPSPMAREIDPTTLYVGNLPPEICVGKLKEFFPNAIGIEICVSLKKKWKRYALVKYASVEEAMLGFTAKFGLKIGMVSLTVRFNRIKSSEIQHEVATENELTRFKIKMEKVDEGYEEVLQKVQLTLDPSEVVPAKYPVARPLIDTSIIKVEPISPKHPINEDQHTLNKSNSSPQCSQQMTDSVTREKSPPVNQIFSEQIWELIRQREIMYKSYGAMPNFSTLKNIGCTCQKPMDNNNGTIFSLPITTSAIEAFSKAKECKEELGTMKEKNATHHDVNDQSTVDRRDATASEMAKNVNTLASEKIDVMKLPKIPKKRPMQSDTNKEAPERNTDNVPATSTKKSNDNLEISANADSKLEKKLKIKKM